MGDLSGKFGTLDGVKEYEASYNDTRLPLFGYESILGRSIVIHKREKMLRWACSSLERGYSPSEAREIRAIASFHNPNGFAYGYMRMTQLIGNDGSQSDTIIETKLRHPGEQDKNVTRNHHWKIFVNPIGVDATVKSATRCVAGKVDKCNLEAFREVYLTFTLRRVRLESILYAACGSSQRRSLSTRMWTRQSITVLCRRRFCKNRDH